MLLIGSGLTMIDTVISLLDQAHTGPIHAISRRGLLPRRHGEAPPQPPLPLAEIDCSSVVAMLQAVRQAVHRAGDDVNAWRSVVDALRPYTQQIWQSLSTAEKRRFLRHLRPWWDVHRHRMAPAVADVIEAAVRRRQLRLQAARLQTMASDRQGVTVTLKKRTSDELEDLRVARVMDCSGPQCDYARIDSPLVRDLLSQGMARPDPLDLGLDVAADSAVINRWGVPSRQIYAFGPVTRGLFWEITSVPDIREQCWKSPPSSGSASRPTPAPSPFARRAREPVGSILKKDYG